LPGIFIASEAKHLFDVQQVLLARELEFGVVQQVVIPVRQPQTALVQNKGIVTGVLSVLADIRLVRHGHANPIEMRDQRRDLLLVSESDDPRELSLQRLQVQLFRGRLVHETRVQIGDLSLIRVRIINLLLKMFDNKMQTVESVISKLVKGAIAALVRRNLRDREPFSIDMLVKIILRTDAIIRVLQLDSGDRCRGARSRLRIAVCGPSNSGRKNQRSEAQECRYSSGHRVQRGCSP
jgi:hypothetical protein